MIEIINLSKSFGKKRVLDNFNVCFTDGANCLIGGSGSGKTTLMNIMSGLIKQDGGEIRGLENKRINCVFQENRLIEGLSAVKNLMLVCGKEKSEDVCRLLHESGLEGSIHCPVTDLSGGMKRRVAIMRALINPADVYIFDEPFKGLDDALKENVIEIIKRHTEKATIILITHDQSDVEMFKANVVKIN